MLKNILTATEVRNNFFKLVDRIATTGEPIYIKTGKEVKVRLAPLNKKDLEYIKD